LSQTYRGPLKAVIFDWAGTVVDFGCRAPVEVFVRAFAAVGIRVDPAEARVPMGLPKWDHIKALGRQPAVAERWERAHGRAMTDGDVDRLYGMFLPLSVATVAEHATLIPGTLETVAALRSRRLAIGSTTGYGREIMDALMPAAVVQGYTPDCLVCPNQVPVGRPSPLMMYKAMLELGVYPAAAVVKVDDTQPGIEEGLAAGSWTVAVSVTGNEVGLSEADWNALPAEERQWRTEAAADRLRREGAHYVIGGVGDLMPVIDDIEERLARGERP